MIPGQRQVDADMGKIIGSAVAVVALVSALIPIRAFAQSGEFKRLPPVSTATASEGGATGVVAAPQTTPVAAASAATTSNGGATGVVAAPQTTPMAAASAAATPAVSASHGTAGGGAPPAAHETAEGAAPAAA